MTQHGDDVVRVKHRDDETQRIFTCPEHNMVIVAWENDEMTSRGSPGHRQPECTTCDQAVHDAMR